MRSPAAGLISVALTSIIFRCNGLEMPNNTDVGGSHRLVVCVFALCVEFVVILVGFMANGRSFRHYGALLGVVAGMLHAAIVQNVMAFHGGFSVLNGGFTVMFVTMMLIPVYRYCFEVRQTPGILPVFKKRG